ncbi:hypothetical protein MPER_15063, partial [Moniliophthora perniciosa FA553]
DLESDDCRRNVPRLSGENIPKILDLTDKIAEMGKKHNATAGQTTLAWTLAQGDDFFVIPGSTTIEFLNENVGAATVKLSSQEVSRIRKFAEEADIQGAGYTAGWNDLVYVDSEPLL